MKKVYRQTMKNENLTKSSYREGYCNALLMQDRKIEVTVYQFFSSLILQSAMTLMGIDDFQIVN